MKTALRLMVFAAALLVGTGASMFGGPGPMPDPTLPPAPGLTS